MYQQKVSKIYLSRDSCSVYAEAECIAHLADQQTLLPGEVPQNVPLVPDRNFVGIYSWCPVEKSARSAADSPAICPSNLVVLMVLLDTAPQVAVRIQNEAKNHPQPPHAVLAQSCEGVVCKRITYLADLGCTTLEIFRLSCARIVVICVDVCTAN